jgi:hypothetical protein
MEHQTRQEVEGCSTSAHSANVEKAVISLFLLERQNSAVTRWTALKKRNAEQSIYGDMDNPNSET